MKKVIALFFAAGILFTQPIMAQEAAATEQAVTTDTNAAPADTAAAATAEEAAPAVEAEASFTQVLKDKFIEGDPLWMAPILLTFILGLALAIERVLYLSMSNNNNEKLLEEVKSALASGGKSAALEVCRSTRGPVASIFYQGLEKMDDGIDMVDKAIVSLGSVENGKLERGVSWISLFIALAPMLGFMGTVIGMIQAFDAIEADIRDAVSQFMPNLIINNISIEPADPSVEVEYARGENLPMQSNEYVYKVPGKGTSEYTAKIKIDYSVEANTFAQSDFVIINI